MSFGHVAINAVFLLPGMGGIETYVHELVPELAAARPDVRFTVFASAQGAPSLAPLGEQGRVEIATHPLLGVPGTKAIAETTFLGALARRRGVDVLHSVAQTGPLATRCAHVVTLHDTTWLEPALPADRVTFAIWRAIVPPVARRADRVVAVSDATARDVVARLRIPASRVQVVHNGFGVGERTTPTPEPELRARLALGERRVVLSVGQMRPHKNLVRLIGAMAELRRRAPDAVLVLVGGPTSHTDELRAEVSRLGLADAVVFAGYVEAADLEGLYAAARCFVMPSVLEGFGMPLLEAQARGVPVASSTAGPMPEVAGEAARFFDPFDPMAIADAVADVLGDDALARRLVAAGHENGARFTWRRTAEGTLDAYERAWRDRRR